MNYLHLLRLMAALCLFLFPFSNNNSQEDFGPEQIITDGIDARSVYAADLNGDGLPDVISDSNNY